MTSPERHNGTSAGSTPGVAVMGAGPDAAPGNPVANGVYDIWTVQLERGPVATPFAEPR